MGLKIPISYVDKDIIGAPKMRNNFWYSFKTVNFIYHSSNFAIAKVFALNPFASFFVLVLYIDSWPLFYIASHIVFALLRS